MDNVDGKLRKLIATTNLSVVTVNDAILRALTTIPEEHPDLPQIALNHFTSISKQVDALVREIDPSLANLVMTPLANKNITQEELRAVPNLLSTMIPSDEYDDILYRGVDQKMAATEADLITHNKNMIRILENFDARTRKKRKTK